jgi:hypothetical protein
LLAGLNLVSQGGRTRGELKAEIPRRNNDKHNAGR